MREIILDTETTGLDPKQGHRVIEIGCIEMIDKIKTGKKFHYYINPERDVPEDAYKIHGISSQFLQDKPLFPHIVEEFLEFVQDSQLVIHNAAFDLKFLNAELEMVKQLPIAAARALDTLLLARKRFPGSPANLDALCKKFNISTSHRTNHGALLDAELLADVYVALTGGTQSAMHLTQTSAAPVTVTVTAARMPREARPFAPSQEELEAHKAFIQKLKKPLWETV